MMTAQDAVNKTIYINEFNALKQAGFFATLKQPRFSGELILKDPRGNLSIFYLYLGRIVYATGGVHPVRRWRRQLAAFFPHFQALASLQDDLASLSPEQLRHCWEYQILCLWIEQGKITKEQAAKMIWSTIVEVLFNLTQAMQITCELQPDHHLSTQLVLIDADQAIGKAKQHWQAWQDAKIADRSPNLAPTITHPEQLQQQTSAQVYQTLSQLLDGEHTLRDIALRMKRDVLAVTRSLLPYVQSGWVNLTEIPDLPSPVAHLQPPEAATSAAPAHSELIACVDDSPLICQGMEQIITQGGYQFLGINDALRAIAVLLARKPNLIFLDLVMPNANGYEICSQLRKLSVFRNTPIVILTGNDGIVDRVRAKMVGASDFLSKPVKQEVVLEVIRKYTKQDSP